ncbi:glycoside hydrolase family 9 protein [Leptolyngbya iicbica]|uniref:glycoside hydrolase family 9 protein n=1 Tax=Leptolyngbya iicbica TaxID=3161580 RepID=UPI000A7F0044|nr:glycoside hydrolase family 9 protein [Leptolyngbya sp. LK]
MRSSAVAPPPNILVDQFGYRPSDTKVAVIQQANATAEDAPSLYQHLTDTFQVVNVAAPDVPVYVAAAELWEAGKIHDQSGDRAAWFDFSTVQTPGEYVVKNARTGETSAQFAIAPDVYQDVLKTATRMYYYQRSGFEKAPPHADPRWTDRAAFLGPGQDPEARFVDDKENAALARDMRGGWFDAGDTNKYITFAAQPLHLLLSAYTQNPALWTDDFNIPESGNGIPDLLDEVRYELDWFQRMQDDDGGVFIKLGALEYDAARTPGRDRRPRFYGPKCSSSTIDLASTFAHAAVVFRDFPALQAEAETLEARSLQAWDWFNRNPIQTECDTQEIKAGDADRDPAVQMGGAVLAAVYLSQLRDDPQFHTYVREHYRETRPFDNAMGVLYASSVVDGLVAYSQFPKTPTDFAAQLSADFSALFFDQLSPFFERTLDLDPYRAYMPDGQYHWGSNAVKSNFGNVNDAISAAAATRQQADMYTDQALGYLHYLHGVNPLGMVYLTNMYDVGAEYSANEMFHEWLGRGIYKNALTSPSGPAPGYLTGGPNNRYTGPAEGLAERPIMRAYLDRSDSELYMWEITEPSITYQAPYIRLLSRLSRSPLASQSSTSTVLKRPIVN